MVRSIRFFLKDKNLCFLGYCDHISLFQQLQLKIHQGYVTLHESHRLWNKQKDLKVMLKPKRLCTLLPGTHCIYIGCHYSRLVCDWSTQIFLSPNWFSSVQLGTKLLANLIAMCNVNQCKLTYTELPDKTNVKDADRHYNHIGNKPPTRKP